MRKDRNRPDSHQPDQSLPRSKILRGRINFQRLFEKSTVLNSNSLQFRYRIYNNPNEGYMIGFAAPKKIIAKATRRNRLKRIMKEVYRTRQSYLSDLFESNVFGFHGLFMAKRENLTFAEIEDEMVSLLMKTKSRLEKELNKPLGSQHRPDEPEN